MNPKSMKNIQKNIIYIIGLIFFFLHISGCGSGDDKNSGDFIPPYIDPNGGPVLIIDVGGTNLGKKSKTNTFQKTHTNDVKVFKLNGTLIGKAEKIQNGLWQIQVPDTSPVLIKAEIHNNQGGYFCLETLMPAAATGTVFINSETTIEVYLARLEAYLQSNEISKISNLTDIMLIAKASVIALDDQSYLNKLIEFVLVTETQANQVNQAAILVKKFLATYAVYLKVNEYLNTIESGVLKTNIPPSHDDIFKSGGLFELQVLTTAHATSKLKPFIDLVVSTLLQVSIASGAIKIDTIPFSTNTKTVSIALTLADIIEMQAFFSTPNTAPTFTSTPIKSAVVGTLYSYTPTANDVDGDNLVFAATILPDWVTFNGTTLSGTPQLTDVGVFSVTITVTDNRVGSPITQNFIIKVAATANIAPVVTSTPTTTATAKILYEHTITATDADGDELVFSFITIPNWLTFNASTGLLSGTPSNTNVGTHSVILTVTDGVVTVQEVFTITVAAAPANKPPEFLPTGALNASEGVLFTKTIVATDPDGDDVTLAAKTLPAWLSFDPNTGILSGTPKNSDFALKTVVITATDGIVTTPVELTLSIGINTIPSFTSTPVTSVVAGQVYQYLIAASDKDGDSVVITTSNLPSFLTLDASTSLLSGSTSTSHIGAYPIDLVVSDNKSVSTGKQSFSLKVLNSLFIAKLNDVEVTDKEEIKLTSPNITLSIKERNTGSGLTFSIKIDNSDLVLTNNATAVTLSSDSQTIKFIAKDSQNIETSISIIANKDTDHTVDIDILGGTKINDSYRKIPGSITISSKFHGTTSSTILSKTILLNDVPQSLNSDSAFVLDPLTIDEGSYTITATISYKDSNNETKTSSSSIVFILVDNAKPTQTVKIGSLTINSDTNFSLHQGTSVTITTSDHDDAEGDAITKGLIIDGTLNENLTTITVSLNSGETKTIKTLLKDPYDEADSYTISMSASSTNGGIPISLSATGTKLGTTTSYRDKVNGVNNTATITATLGVDSENDGVKLIEWLVNSVVVANQNSSSLILDLSTYGGTTVTVMCRVTDNFTANPAITTATLNLVVALDNPPTFTSAIYNGSTIALSATLSVDHGSFEDRLYTPLATDPENDSFSYQFVLNNNTTSGDNIFIPYTTLTGAVLTVKVVQFNTIAATNTHNISSNNVVPTPILIGNTSHTDLNGNYSLIVRPGVDIEGDRLITTVTLNGSTIVGVVINNEIHYSISLTALGGTTAVFVATNDDGVATPISTTLNVGVIQSLSPASLSAKRGNASVTLSWNSVNTATSYNLYYGTAINITTGSTKISSITSPYTLTGLTNGTTYYFRVSANHVSAEGTLSNTDIPMTPHAPGDTLVVNVSGQNFTFKFIPAGSFTMGAPSSETGFTSGEDPQHTVTISSEFWMLQNEVTQAQWSAIITSSHPTIAASPSFFTGSSLPVELVSWEDIMESDGFIANLHLADVNTVLTSGLYKLPTEAQWEYAYRAGTTTRFYWGSDASLSLISTYAWYSGNAATTNNVAGKTANAWGLFDMSGNVSEWCLDKTPSAYTSASVTDPQGGTTGNERIYRGGSWFDSANNCRAAKRYSASKDIKGTNLGFRFIRVPLATE